MAKSNNFSQDGRRLYEALRVFAKQSTELSDREAWTVLVEVGEKYARSYVDRRVQFATIPHAFDAAIVHMIEVCVLGTKFHGSSEGEAVRFVQKVVYHKYLDLVEAEPSTDAEQTEKSDHSAVADGSSSSRVAEGAEARSTIRHLRKMLSTVLMELPGARRSSANVFLSERIGFAQPPPSAQRDDRYYKVISEGRRYVREYLNSLDDKKISHLSEADVELLEKLIGLRGNARLDEAEHALLEFYSREPSNNAEV